MISLLCQKSTSGVISMSDESHSRTYLDELLNEEAPDDNRTLQSIIDDEYPSEFMKRLAASKHDFTAGTTTITSRSKSIKSAPMSIMSSSRANTKIGTNGGGGLGASNRSVSFDPSLATREYYRQHPFRRLSSKKLMSVQNWINQKISEDPANLSYYVSHLF